MRRSPFAPPSERTTSPPKRRLALAAVAIVVVAAAAATAVPMGRDAWTTWRTGVAPGSKEALRAAAWRDGWVVVGVEFEGDGANPRAWLVEDGEWEPLGSTRPARQFTDVAIVDDRAIASGSLDGAPALFESRSGDDWRVAWRGDGHTGELSALAAAGDDVVAVGWTMSDTERTAIVLSSDGDSWVPTDLHSGAWLTAVTAVGDTFVGAGQLEQQSSAAVWIRQPDGQWAAVELAAGGAKRSFISAITATQTRVVAVGSIDTGPAAWVRDNGAWSSAIALPRPGHGGFRATSIAATPEGGFVAGGVVIGIGDVMDSIAWSSANGLDWRTRPIPGIDGGVSDLVPSGDRIAALSHRREAKRTTPRMDYLDDQP